MKVTALRRVPLFLMALLVAGTAAVFIGASPAHAYGSFTLRSVENDAGCVDVQSETAGNVRTNVQLYRCRAAGDPLVAWQAFKTIPIPGRPHDEFKIRNDQTGKCLTYVPGGDPRNVWAESCDRPGQGWGQRVAIDPNTQYTFEPVEAPAQCLDIAGIDYRNLPVGIDIWPCGNREHPAPWLAWYRENL